MKGLCFEPFRSVDIPGMPWESLRSRPDPNYRLEKASHTRRVISFMWAADPAAGIERDHRLYAKRARVRSIRKTLMSFLRPCKMRKEFFLGLRLLDLSIPTPLPVLYAERRVAGFLRENYLVTVELAGARPFSALFYELESSADKMVAMREAATFILSMLRKGFQHIDCESAHLFVKGSAAMLDANKRMYFIDVDGGRLNVKPTDAVKRKISFQFFRSFRRGSLDRTSSRTFIETFFERVFTDKEFDDFLAILEKMEMRTQRRKRILKALYLKRKGKPRVHPQQTA